MDLGFKSKIAIVTGASKGIGAACAEILASEGAKVVLVARTPRYLDSLAKRLARRYRTEVGFISADIFPVDKHPRDEGHDDPRIPRRGQSHDHLLPDIHADLGPLGIDDRGLPDDNHLFAYFGHLERDFEVEVPSENEDQLVSDQGVEPIQFEL